MCYPSSKYYSFLILIIKPYTFIHLSFTSCYKLCIPNFNCTFIHLCNEHLLHILLVLTPTVYSLFWVICTISWAFSFLQFIHCNFSLSTGLIICTLCGNLKKKKSELRMLGQHLVDNCYDLETFVYYWCE